MFLFLNGVQSYGYDIIDHRCNQLFYMLNCVCLDHTLVHQIRDTQEVVTFVYFFAFPLSYISISHDSLTNHVYFAG